MIQLVLRGLFLILHVLGVKLPVAVASHVCGNQCFRLFRLLSEAVSASTTRFCETVIS